MQTEERECDDSLVDEDRVSLAAPDELREGEGDGRRADDGHRCLALLLIWGLLMPERADHVHEDAGALAFDRCQVGAFDEREDLVQPRRLGILIIRWEREIVAVLG